MLQEEKDHIEFLGKQIAGIACHNHKAQGPCLLERMYETCFCHELPKGEIHFIKQKTVSVVYDGIEFYDGLTLDILVADATIIEFKNQEKYHPVWEAQLLSYLRLSIKHLGYIINFTVPLIKDGIKRMVL